MPDNRNLCDDPPLDSLRPVAGFPGYFADATGAVYSVKKLTPVVDHRGGYLRYHVVGGDGTRKRLGAHQAVCRAFHGGPPSSDSVVRHLDGDTMRNTPDNVRWGTAMENAQDRVRHGRQLRGAAVVTAKLTEPRVRAMVAALKRGMTVEKASRDFGVSVSAVKAVLTGKTWRHVTGGPVLRRHNNRGWPRGSASPAKLTPMDVRSIRRRCARGQTQAVVAADYAISEAQVSNIVRRVCWKGVT